MASIIAPESLLRTIASLQTELAQLQTALGVEGVTIATKKTKKAKDPNAEPKEPNVWIKFTQRVGALIKEAHPDNKAPATLGKQFCSFLKEQKAYDQWDDAEILEAFTTWEAPETSKMERDGKTKKAKADSASDSGSVSDAPKRGPKGPLSEEAKAARREKMAAKKAATSTAEPVESAAPKAFKPKTVTKPTYTMEQLADLDSFDHEGVPYGRNIRGDVVGEDGGYVGHWDGKTLKRGAAPADWAAVQALLGEP